MGGEDGAVRRPSVPEVVRRFLDRLDRLAPLPPGADFVPRSRPGTVSPDLQGRRVEPAADVIVGVDAINVTIDLPRVRRRDIDLQATESSRVARANLSTRTYYREIPLPASVSPDVIRSAHKNGVPDVSLTGKERTWRIPVQ